MTKEEYIKTFEGVIIGIIETKENGDQLARDFSSRMILGYYIKSRDVTTDFYGRVVSRGNTVVSFIYKNKAAK